MLPTSVDPPHRRCASDRPITVVLADDECMFRASLRQLLTAPPPIIKEVYGVDVGPGFEVVGEAGSGEETIAVVRSVKPDLLLLDVSMPRKSGLEALAEMQACRDGVRTIVLAGTIERPHLLTAVQLHVHGLVVKDSTTELLFEAIVSVMGGRHWLGHTLVSDLVELVRTFSQKPSSPDAKPRVTLTPREREVLALVVAGCTNKEIATQFTVSGDRQAPSHSHVRQGRRVQPAGAGDESDAERPRRRPLIPSTVSNNPRHARGDRDAHSRVADAMHDADRHHRLRPP